MMIETLFSLHIDGVSLDVDEWTNKLGLQAIECCRFGDKLPNSISGTVSRSSYWTYGIKKTEASSLNHQLSKLLDVLGSKENEINELIKDYPIECGVASFIWVDLDENCDPEEDLDINLSKKNIKTLANLQADYSVSIY